MKLRATSTSRPTGRAVPVAVAVFAVLAVALAACAKDAAPPPAASASSPGSGTPTTAGGRDGPSTTPAPGPAARPTKGAGAITLVTLGDSLTAGQGEEPERGYPERLKDWLEANGHPGSTVVNLGRSGWTSQQVIDGADGERGQLASAQEAIEQAASEGTPVIATLLIGSNDLWYLYNNDAPTTADDERTDLATYRANLQKIVSTLRAAGASVVLGINDDQSHRPMMTDATMRENTFPAITAGEVTQMSAQAKKYATVVREVAADNGALVVDFLDAPLFRDPARLNEDGGHPNSRGYDEMTEVWRTGLQPLV
jgi:lysophospholipase L1-like esterase